MDTAATAAGVVAAITAAIYAFKKFSDQSNEVGADLIQFGNLTKTPIDTLQRWQQLGISSSVTTDEVTQSFKNLQDIMFKMVAGGVMPAGIGRLDEGLAKIGKPLHRNMYRDIPYMMNKIREYAQAFKDQPDATEDVLNSLGLGKKFQHALMTSSFDLAKADPARMYSKKQAKALYEMQIQWKILADQINHAIGRLNMKFGPELLKDVRALASSFISLAEALGKLNEQLKIFKLLSSIVSIFANLGKATAVGINKGAKEIAKPGGIVQIAKDVVAPSEPISKTSFTGLNALIAAHPEWRMPAPAQQGDNITHFNTHVTVHGAADGADIAQQINDAFRQIQNASTGSGI